METLHSQITRRGFLLSTAATVALSTAAGAQVGNLPSTNPTNFVRQVQMGTGALPSCDGYGPGRSYAFLDIIKGSGPWKDQTNNYINPTIQDKNGWPTTMGSNKSLSATLELPPKSLKPGSYKVIVQDVCTFYFTRESGGNTPLMTSRPGTNVYTVDLNQSSYSFISQLVITAIGSNYCKGISLVNENDYAAWEAGAVFDATFKDRLAQLKSMRFMDWMRTNGSFNQAYADYIPLTYRSYSNSWWDPTALNANNFVRDASDKSLYTLDYPAYSLNNEERIVASFSHKALGFGTCTGIKKGTTTVITLQSAIPDLTVGMNFTFQPFSDNAGYALVANFAFKAFKITDIRDAGLTVELNYNSSSLRGEITGTAFCGPVTYLNIGKIGPKPLLNIQGYYKLGAPPFVQPGGTWNAGELRSVRYCPARDGYVVGYPENYGCFPLSLMVRLANETGTEPYFCIPHLACDVAGNNPSYTNLPDWQRRSYAYVRDNLNAGIKSHWEVSNEVWNTSDPFYQTGFSWVCNSARQPAAANLTLFGSNQWIGYAASMAGQCAANVFGYTQAQVKTQSRYAIVIPYAAAAAARPLSGGNESKWRCTSDQYVAAGGKAAKDWCQELCFAVYWSAGYYSQVPPSKQFPIPGPEAQLAALYRDTRDPAYLDEYIQSSVGVGPLGKVSEFTATISGTTMTVSSVSYGRPGGNGLSDYVNGAQLIPAGSGVASNTWIVGQLTGTPGGAGTYTISPAQTVPSPTLMSSLSVDQTIPYFEKYIFPNLTAAGTLYGLTIIQYEAGWNSIPSGAFPPHINALRLDARTRNAFGDCIKRSWESYKAAGPNMKLPCNFQMQGTETDIWACWFPSVLQGTPAVPQIWRAMRELSA